MLTIITVGGYMFGKRKIAMMVAELLGTFALASSVLAIVMGLNIPFFGALTAGLTLAAMVLVIGPVSGAHINPAVTVGLWSIRKVSTSKAVVYILLQLGAGLAALKLNEHLLDRTVPGLTQADWDWRIVLAEAIGTFLFTFGIASAVYNRYEGGRLAAAIGASLFVGIMAASFGSNGVLNPAVAIGINSWSISYAVAPLFGAILGMNLYARLFAPVMESKTSAKTKKR